MIGGEQPTPLDVRFPLGPIPVRVSVLFWVIMALLGLNWTDGPPETNRWVNLLIWVGCGFVSILVHELGHALAHRLFGAGSAIVLHGFGGYAIPSHEIPSAGKRLVVALAGPAAGFVLYGVVYALTAALDANRVALNPYAANALDYLLWMTLVWNVFNLFPILPLDGGRVVRELLALFRAPNPDGIAHGLSFVLALLLAVWGALRNYGMVPAAVLEALPDWFVRYVRFGVFGILWFAVLAIDNFQRMQMHTRRRGYYDQPDDDVPPWRR